MRGVQNSVNHRMHIQLEQQYEMECVLAYSILQSCLADQGLEADVMSYNAVIDGCARSADCTRAE
eukprot:2510668-Amphidinium_carterae.1